MKTSTKIQSLVNYTNSRLENWYLNAKEEYGVIGTATAKYYDEMEMIAIESEENGIISILEIHYVLDQDQDYAFNVWMESI